MLFESSVKFLSKMLEGCLELEWKIRKYCAKFVSNYFNIFVTKCQNAQVASRDKNEATGNIHLE